MKYEKPALTFEQQVDLLFDRGMQGDREVMTRHLSTVSYYRLSAYWYPFRQAGTEVLKPNTRWDVVWDRYMFDRQLRLLLLDAIERIEVAVRTLFTYHHSHKWGSFGYAVSRQALEHLRDDEWEELQATIQKEIKHNKEEFVKFFRGKYTAEQHLPLWMLTEIVPFGAIVRMVGGSDKETRALIAQPFGVHARVFESWLPAINAARNICAHHCRLWNRVLGMTPAFPDAEEWTKPVNLRDGQNGKRVFGLLTVSNYCLNKISPQHSWARRFVELLDRFPHVPRKFMGLADNWMDCPIWSNAKMEAAPALGRSTD